MCVNQYNILFLYSNVIDPLKGGVQSVTYELSQYFTSNGCCCYYLGLNKTDKDINTNVQFYLPNSSKFNNNENREYLLSFIKDKKINILINQGGISCDCSNLAYIVKPYGVKIISCIHNSLLDIIRNFDILYYNKLKRYKIHKLLSITKYSFVKNILYILYYFKYSKHYRRLCENSDKIVLLSDSFKKDLSFFTKELSDKVCSIPNPIPSKISEINIGDEKEKIVLYVGRVDTLHKKVDLLLNIWSLLYKKHKDWKLVIVGGGDELNKVKQYAYSLRVENVLFEGFKDPIPYYKRASIFCMTSASEGFGIVLIEAMNMKVVPIAFDSFSAVRDIIDDGTNGVLVPPFNQKLYSEKISYLMNNEQDRLQLSYNAYEKSKEFKLYAIGNRWLALFSSLFNCKIN